MGEKGTVEYIISEFKRLFNRDKTKKEIIVLSEAYSKMMAADQKHMAVRRITVKKIDERSELCISQGINVTSKSGYDFAYLGDKLLCKCDAEWVDVYEILVKKIDEIIDAFKSNNLASQKLVKEWKNETKFFENWQKNGLSKQLKAMNSEISDSYKEMLLTHSERERTYKNFHKIPDADLFERYFAKDLQGPDTSNGDDIVK